MIKLITKQLKLSDVFEKASLSELSAYCESISSICFDSETTGYDAHSDDFISVQIGNKDVQYVIDCSTIDIKEIKPILESGKQVLFQNAQFDLRFLLKHGIDVKNIYDTFLAELILTTGYEHKERNNPYFKGTSLEFLARKYCSQILNKEVRGQIHWRGLDETVIRYGAKDIEHLEEIRDKQLIQIHRWQLENLLELENKVTRVFAIMSFNGIKLNKEKWLEVANITEQGVKDLIKELDTIVLNEPLLSRFIPKAIQQNLFGFEERTLSINWGSPLQKLELAKALGLPMESVGYRDLQKNRKQHILIEKLIEYSKQDKLATAFGKAFLKFINKDTNRVHMSIWPILSTGRIAVSEPNLNQIPSRGDLAKEIRSAFIPKDGYKIVGGDFSNFELRIIAEFSDDPLWIKVFKEDGDLHSELCAMTFNIDIKDVKKPFPPKPSITYRDVQKTVDFGLAYGMSEFKLADTIDVSVDEAKSIIKKFFDAVPKVKEFLDYLGNLGKARGYIRTAQPFGRVRWFPEWQDLKNNPEHPDKLKILGSIERKSKNMPIQGVNADIIKLALINIQEEIDSNKWPVKILLSVYDEIQTECREDLTEQWKTKLEDIMIKSAETILKKVPIKVDCKITDYWTK